MTESTLKTPCMIAFCKEVPGNINKIFNGADVEEHTRKNFHFDGPEKIDLLHYLLGSYDEVHYSHALVIKSFTEAQRMAAKLNGNLDSVFILKNQESIEFLDTLYYSCICLNDSEEKLKECINNFQIIENYLIDRMEEHMHEHGQKLMEKIEDLKADFEAYHDQLHKIFNSLKL